jgi:predicted PurR-regulated permease PerM
LRRAGDRLFGSAGDRVGYQAIVSIRGAIDGRVLVGVGEGTLMTVAHLLPGVPNPLLLGALTAVAAMIPFGAAVLLVIAAARLPSS